jgi:hypothetical protein
MSKISQLLSVGMKRWHLDSHKGCLGLVIGLIHWLLVNSQGVHVPNEYAGTIHGNLHTLVGCLLHNCLLQITRDLSFTS